MTNPTTTSSAQKASNHYHHHPSNNNPSPTMSTAVVVVGENGGGRSLFRPPPLSLALSSTDYSPPSPRLYPPPYSPAALSYFGSQSANASPSSAPSSPSTPYFFPFSHLHPYPSRHYLQIESYSTVLASLGSGGPGGGSGGGGGGGGHQAGPAHPSPQHPPPHRPIFSVASQPPPTSTPTHFGIYPPPPTHLHPSVSSFPPPSPQEVSSPTVQPVYGTGLPVPRLVSPSHTPEGPPMSPASSSSHRSPSPMSSVAAIGSSPYRLPCGKEGSLKHRFLTRPSPGHGGPGSDVQSTVSGFAPTNHVSPSSEDSEGSESSSGQGQDQVSSPKKWCASPASASTTTTTSVVTPKASVPASSYESFQMVGQPPYPAHFTKGSIIQLASKEFRRVEDLRTEDFVQSAELSPDLQIDSSTVVKIEDKPKLGLVTLGFSVGEQRVQVSVDATPEHPFFVFGQGWSSCCPERTLQRYSLTCHKLQVGDVCISLTHRSRRQQSNPSSMSSSATHSRRTLPKVTLAPAVTPQIRKRRWSASDALTLTATTTAVEQRSNSLAESHDTTAC